MKLLDARGTVFCKEGICEYQYQRASGLWDSTGEYAGQIQQTQKTPVVLLSGYYLGNGEDGRIVAYLKGTGPEVNGKVATPLKNGSGGIVDQVGTDKCVDQWSDAFHKQNGEDAMIMADVLNEWEIWCKAGKPP